jgi:sigma-54-specific transcriptional regulator
MSILEFSRPDMPVARARALVFESPVSVALLKLLDRIAPTDTTVLVTGDTGTGKEIVARYLHDHSGRANGPFLAVNCGALSPALIESELFGHERGAFTGALATQPGWFEAANKGTLFLDEVADLPLAGQVKLLRVLQEREVVRVGARRAAPVDVRLIAATNANLQSAVAAGQFREDLFYRLHVAHVALAPLRDRREDILPLARHFLARHAALFGIREATLTKEACASLVQHDWPGNIRALENVIQRALLVAPAGRVDEEHLCLANDPLVSAGPSSWPPLPPSPSGRPGLSVAPFRSSGASEGDRLSDKSVGFEQAILELFETGAPKLLDEIDEIVVRAAYRVSNNNQVRTARLLGVSRNVLRSRLMRYGLLALDSRRATLRLRDDAHHERGAGPISTLKSVTRSPSGQTAW